MSRPSARTPEELDSLLQRARRALAVLIGVVLVLGAGIAVLLRERANPSVERLAALAEADEEVRRAAVRELVEGGRGVWDTHLDPDVGRVLQPDLDGREFRGSPLSSNAVGMREASWETPKPAGTVRVVLLGDSMVFGLGVAAEERLGVHLAGFLEERARTPGVRVESLHLAASSWDIVAECAYLRRQLRFLEPDLVVQVVTVNDLNDTRGVRGFGSMGSFSPRVRERANGVIGIAAHSSLWPDPIGNRLIEGLDHESRSRFERAADDIAGLAAAVEASGGKYLLLGGFGAYNPMVQRYLARGLRDDQVAYLSNRFSRNPDHVLGAGDGHWSPAGHRMVAILLYGLAFERDLLPAVRPKRWKPGTNAVELIHGEGAREAQDLVAWDAALPDRVGEVRSALDFTDVDEGLVRQVHGGVDAEGLVAPYASMLLARGAGTNLRIEARRLDAPELAGGTVRLYLDEVEVAAIALTGETELIATWPLPAEVADRPYLSLRLSADDYVYRDADSGRCVALRLRRVAIE